MLAFSFHRWNFLNYKTEGILPYIPPEDKLQERGDAKLVDEGIQRMFIGFSDKILDWLAKVDQERVRMIFDGRWTFYSSQRKKKRQAIDIYLQLAGILKNVYLLKEKKDKWHEAKVDTNYKINAYN